MVEALDWELVAEARVATERPWLLYVGSDTGPLEAAGRSELARHAGAEVIALPRGPALQVALHRLTPPDVNGERVVWAPRVDTGCLEGPFAAGSPLYLLPLLVQRAGGEPLTIVATALEDNAKDLIAQRGLWSRFEVRRVSQRGQTPCPDPDMVSVPFPNSPDRGLALLLDARALKPPELIARLREAIALEPDLPAAHYELGKALIAADDIEGAVASFRRTTELLPDFGSAWGNLGAALGELQRLDESTEALRRAVALDPLSHALHSNLGVALRDGGQLDEAASHLARAIELEPGFVFGHYNLAGVYFLAARYEEAIEAFERARRLDRSESQSPRQSLLLAATRLAAGDVPAALDAYREVFARLEDNAMKRDLRAVAEWDLKQLAARAGVSEPLREAAILLRSLA